MSETATTLKAWALEAGFDRAGIAALDRSATGEAFVRWLEAGHHAEMSWLERRVEDAGNGKRRIARLVAEGKTLPAENG